MKITFLIRGKHDPATIYLRARTDLNDVKVKTDFKVDSDHWERGKVKLHKIGRTIDAWTNEQNRQNKELVELQKNLDYLRTQITTRYLNDRPILTNNWIREQLNPAESQIMTFGVYVSIYLRLSGISKSTDKKIRSTLNRILAYKDVDLTKVDKSYRRDLQIWLSDQGYAHNTAVKTIKVMQTVCTHAHDNGYKVHLDSLKLSKGLRYQKPPHVFLTPHELAQLEHTEFKNDLHCFTRDWLLISCYTGQRMGDLFAFTKKQINEIEGHRVLSIVQSKTGEPVNIPLTSTVDRILSRYDGDFPPQISKAKSTNEVLYNRHLKTVCKNAGINDIVIANIRSGNRYKVAKVSKWEAVSSHIGRRSFATNYFGKMPTSFIRRVTGHKSEQQLLKYIGKAEVDNLGLIAEIMKENEPSPLSMVAKMS